jgi:hypothetical protein
MRQKRQVEGTTGLLIAPEATMLTDRNLTQADLKHRTAHGLWSELSDMVAYLRRDLFSGYHPERHYMRGPGPACRAKRMAATNGLLRQSQLLQQLPLKLEVALQEPAELFGR